MARISDEKHAAIIATLRSGERHSVRDVAKQHGVAFSTVSRIAREEVPGAFDRSRTRAAADARNADGKKRRADLRQRLLDEAEDALNELHQPYLVHSFGGRENVYREHRMDKPPSEAKQRMMTIAAIAIDKHAALEKLDSTAGSEEAVSMLGKLADGFAEVWREQRQEAPGAGQPADEPPTDRVDRDQ